jgi:hypothetical protein
MLLKSFLSREIKKHPLIIFLNRRKARKGVTNKISTANERERYIAVQNKIKSISKYRKNEHFIAYFLFEIYESLSLSMLLFADLYS